MKNMKKLIGFVLFGLVMATDLVAAGRKGKKALGGSGDVISGVAVKIDSGSQEKVHLSSEVAAESEKDESSGKPVKRVKKEQPIPSPSPATLHVVGGVSSSSNSVGEWHDQKISKASIEAFLDGFAAKQAQLFAIMIDRGFAPLAAAVFLGLDAENTMTLLAGVDYQQMVVAPAFVAKPSTDNASILNLVMELAPLVSGVIGRSPAEMAKWFVRRVAMSQVYSKITGTHCVVMAGYTEVIFAGMPANIAQGLIAHVNEKTELTIQECALNSQSHAAAQWAGLPEEEIRAMKINVFFEDVMACPQAIASQFMTAEMGSSIGGMLTSDANIAMVLAMLTPERMEAVLGLLTDERIATISQTFEQVADNPKTTAILQEVVAKMPQSLKSKLVTMAAHNAISSAKTAAWNAVGSLMMNASSMFLGTGQEDEDDDSD